MQGPHLEYITLYIRPDTFLYPFYTPANSSLVRLPFTGENNNKLLRKKSKSKKENSHHSPGIFLKTF